MAARDIVEVSANMSKYKFILGNLYEVELFKSVNRTRSRVEAMASACRKSGSAMARESARTAVTKNVVVSFVII